MYLTGIADEASQDIEEQIKATKELGWNAIESRFVNGKNIHDISDEEFDDYYQNSNFVTQRIIQFILRLKNTIIEYFNYRQN